VNGQLHEEAGVFPAMLIRVDDQTYSKRHYNIPAQSLLCATSEYLCFCGY